MTDLLGPNSFDSFIGQEKLKERLNVHIGSAKCTGTRLDHILLVAPPGAGKTSLARIIANEMGHDFEAFIMPIEIKLLASIVRGFRGIVLFDELHRSPPKQQELLLTVLEGGYLQLPSGRRYSTDNELTVIGATTEPEKIIAPLYDRFPIRPAYDEYSHEEMTAIVQQNAKIMGITISHEDALVYGRAASGTPRNAKAFVLMARDLLLANSEKPTADTVMSMMKITKTGLTEDHLRYLSVLQKIGGVAGIKVLSNHLRLPEAFLLEIERNLIKEGLIEYTSRGRELVNSQFGAQ